MKEIPIFENYAEKLLLMAWGYLPKLMIALLTLIIGFWLANRISSWLRAILVNRNTNPNIIPFLSSLVSILVKVLVLISVAAKFGIETTSFVALLGGAGLAVGLALQGNLSNFASGVMILVFKPFKIGDKVVIAGYSGVVTEILIFNTVLRTADNKRIIIPNNSITSAAITNVSGNGELRTELNFKVSGEEDIDKVKSLILEVCNKSDDILKQPTPAVSINTEDLSTSMFSVKVWSAADATSRVTNYLNEEVKRTFVMHKILPPPVS